MNITFCKRLGLLAFLLPCALAFSATTHAETNKLVIESGDSAQSRQQATMQKEQWNETRNLRQKSINAPRKNGIRLTPHSIAAINANKVPTLMPTGNRILYVARTVVLAA